LLARRSVASCPNWLFNINNVWEKPQHEWSCLGEWRAADTFSLFFH
jgi:hypothetical protein